MNPRRLRAIARKEFLHILRDARSLTLALALPLVMLLLFGVALTLDVDRIPTYVWDQDHTPESRDLIAQFRGSRYFEIQAVVNSYAPIETAIAKNRALLGVVIPQTYSRDLQSGRSASVQLIFDGTDSNTASIAAGYADSLLQAYAAQLKIGAARVRVPVSANLRVLYNSELKSRNYIVPGLIALILMIIAALLTGLTIAREWENGTMEQLLSTPVRPREIVLGKLLAYFAVGFLDLAICIVVGVFIFGVPFRGSWLFLLVTSSTFLFGALCWGLFISAATRSQLLAYQMSMLTSFLPAFLLSGFIYSVEDMPRVIQLISYVVPARYYIKIVNAIFLKGAGPGMLWVPVLLLFVYAAIIFAAATRKMNRKIA